VIDQRLTEALKLHFKFRNSPINGSIHRALARDLIKKIRIDRELKR